MGLLLAVAAALAVFGIATGLFSRKTRNAERARAIERRVNAYMASLRRESRNPEIGAMSDAELRDLLLSSMHNLRVEAERKSLVVIVASGLAVVAAIAAASQDGVRGFAIGLAIGGVAVYGLNEFLLRRMQAPLLRMGLDVERLRVE
jgi:hypothetical protein